MDTQLRSIADAINLWESSGEMNIEMAKIIEENFDALMSVEMEEIERFLNKKKPHTAWARLTRITSLFNIVRQKKPSIHLRLEKWIFKIRQISERIATELGASGFNMTIGIVQGVTVSMSFPAK